MTRLLTRRRVILQLGSRDFSVLVWDRDGGETPLYRVVKDRIKAASTGVDPRTIQELGGWASLGMVRRYTHLSPTHKAGRSSGLPVTSRGGEQAREITGSSGS